MIQTLSFCIKNHEQRELPRVVVMDDTAVKVGQDSVRKERISMRLKPVIDQRFDGIATEAFAQDQDRQALIFYFGDSNCVIIQKEAADGRIISRWGSKIHTNQWSLKTDYNGTGQRWSVRFLSSRTKLNVNTALNMCLQDTKIASVDAPLSIPIQTYSSFSRASVKSHSLNCSRHLQYFPQWDQPEVDSGASRPRW